MKIQQITPTLEWKQAKDKLDWSVLTKACSDGKIKRSPLEVQTTTTEQNPITHQSKWRWCGFVTYMFNVLRKKNMGVCKNTGKTFGELMRNFVLDLVEAYILADAGINIRIIGAAERKKHENIIQGR